MIKLHPTYWKQSWELKQSTYNVTYLMCSAYEIKVMLVKKLGHNVSTKCKGNTPVIFSPALHIFFRVSPKQVT